MTTENDRTHTVLIVDDSKEDRYLLQRYLKKTNLSLVVLEASNGQDAIDFFITPRDELLAQHPDIQEPLVVFLDINMPIMTGWEFLSELEQRQDELALKHSIVVMYSTSDADYEKERAGKFSAVSRYIVKSETTPETLKQVILDSKADA
ncbi:MAG: response regulator [Granulosicoccus sp.]